MAHGGFEEDVDHASLPSLRTTRTHVSLGKLNSGSATSVAFPASRDSNAASGSETVAHEAFAVAVGDHVEVLDRDLQTLATLSFDDAFPSTSLSGNERQVDTLAIDPVNGRVVAAASDRVAVWARSQHGRQWKVHSTLSTGFPVASLSVSDGEYIDRLKSAMARAEHCVTPEYSETLVAVGSSLAVYSLQDSNGFVTWSRRHMRLSPVPITSVSISASHGVLACSFRKHHIVQIMRYTETGAVTTIAEPWHPRPVRSLAWIEGASPGTQASTTDSECSLLTETEDGIVRVWRCLPDEPDFFVLWHTFNPPTASSSPSICNIWLGDRGLFTVAQDGRASVTRLINLEQPATTATRSTTTHLNGCLPKRCLPFLRYSVSHNSTTLLLRSRSGGVALLHLESSSGSCKAHVRRLAAIRPSQPIVRLVASEDHAHVLSCGSRGEIILWQARRLGSETASMTAIAINHRVMGGRILAAAVSPDGQSVWAKSDSRSLLLRRSGTRLLEVQPPGMDSSQASDMLEAVFDSTNDGRLHLVLVGNSGILLTCLILVEPDLALEVVCQVDLNVKPTRVALSPQAVSSMTKVVVADDKGNLLVSNIHLDGKATAYRQASRLAISQRQICLLCSSASHVASVDLDGHLLITNTQASLFTSGQEYSQSFGKDVVRAISFSSTPDNLPLLLVTLDDRILVISQRRLDYYKENTLWVPASETPIVGHGIVSASAFTWANAVLLACGTRTILLSHHLTGQEVGSLIQQARRLNAPLPDYHPQFLMQLLLSNRASLVDKILLRLRDACKRSTVGDDHAEFVYPSLPLSEYTARAPTTATANAGASDFFLSLASRHEGSDKEMTSEDRAGLLKAITEGTVPGLTTEERDHLKVVVETVEQVEAQRRSLDTNGMRFLTSLRSFAITQGRKASATSPPGANRDKQSNGTSIPDKRSPTPSPIAMARLRYRDNLWAFFSESQDILLTACHDACAGPMLWQNARALGLALWVKSSESLATQLETIARNEYTTLEDRDPTVCSLYYFALRKKRLVQGLWRQATFHKERNVMMKFLMNDFEEPRWKSAAMKNAYALMGKHRYAYAAAFFLLGDSLKDCVGVCLRQLDDFHLALTIARVYEGDDGPVVRDILNRHVLPLAFTRGHRRLAIWAFWMLKRRDLAVQAIVTPMSELASGLDNPLIKGIGLPGQEDSSLILLYLQLRDWSLQTLQGSAAIAPIRETQFVLHIAQTLCRMGCHPLAVDLTSNWKFSASKEQIMALISKPVSKERMLVSGARQTTAAAARPNGHTRRRSSLLMPKRRSTIVLDVPSAVPSRSGSPERKEIASPQEQQAAEEKAGFKKVVREVKAPPPEFDMSSFGF